MTTVLEPPDTNLQPAPLVTPLVTPRRMWLGFAAVLSAVVLNILDSTLVNVAGPSIRTDLAMSTSALEWVAAAYTLALAVGLMTGARLGDMFGRKRLFLLGLGGFVATSVLCSAAWSPEVLIGARTAQGLSAALLLPQGFGLFRDVFPGPLVSKAFAAMGPAIGLATVLGPVTAGLLIKADLLGTGWRAMFWINVPLGLFAMLVGARVLPSAPPAHRGARLDVVGMVLLAGASVLLVLPLVEGRAWGWPVWSLVMLVAAAPAYAVFGLHQRARLRAGRQPLVEVTVLRKRSYVSGVVFVLMFFGALTGFTLGLGLFLQIGLGMSPMRASLYLAAMAVGAFLGAGVGAWAAEHVGRPILHIGLTVMAVGTTILWFALHDATTVGAAQLVPGLGVFGVGMGMIFVPLFSIIMGEIEDRELGSASGLLTSLEQLGSSLGVAVLGTVFFGALRIEDGGPVAAMTAGRHLVAIDETLLWVLGALAVTWVLGWFLPRRAKPMR